jgi:hypothetical protein
MVNMARPEQWSCRASTTLLRSGWLIWKTPWRRRSLSMSWKNRLSVHFSLLTPIALMIAWCFWTHSRGCEVAVDETGQVKLQRGIFTVEERGLSLVSGLRATILLWRVGILWRNSSISNLGVAWEAKINSILGLTRCMLWSPGHWFEIQLELVRYAFQAANG